LKKVNKDKGLEKTPLYCQNEETRALRSLLSKVGDKWSILIVVILSRSKDQTARFSTLLKSVDGISQRMLTTTLRDLERDGFVKREVYPESPPRVEYELTTLGKSLMVPMQHLVQWTVQNWREIKKAQDKFDQKSS
jgi:DNA-binding HxlR family transcriptional regulator